MGGPLLVARRALRHGDHVLRRGRHRAAPACAGHARAALREHVALWRLPRRPHSGVDPDRGAALPSGTAPRVNYHNSSSYSG